MATYFLFGEYSQDSIKGISAQRSEAARKVVSDAGGKIEAGYALLGEHDLLLKADFPGTNQAMKASVGLAKLLGISFSTAPAISIEEFDNLVG